MACDRAAWAWARNAARSARCASERAIVTSTGSRDADGEAGRLPSGRTGAPSPLIAIDSRRYEASSSTSTSASADSRVSLADLALLQAVSEPVATNPGPALEAIARERGWRILRLFEQ